MLNLSIDEIINASMGKLIQGQNKIINQISLDTRSIHKNDFFIAIKGQNFDGHDYLVEACKKGASGALIDIMKLNKIKSDFTKNGYPEIPADFILIKVENTLRSLGLIAAFYRRRFNIKVVAVTGSNGKTTTKELIYQLLLTKFKENEILKTEKNFNNEIGVPLTLFKLNPKIKTMVVELGINHIGEMQRLAYMVDPDYGIITNIGETHLEFLKNDKIVAKAKGELVPFIKNTLVFNFDDKYYNYFLYNSECKVIGFTLNSTLNLDRINKFDSYTGLGLQGFNVNYRGVSIKYNLLGDHNLYNLLGSLTISEFFGVDFKKIKPVVEKFKSLEDRGHLLPYKNGNIFFDAYNANPTSVKAMLYFSHQLSQTNKIAILGDMMELGKKAMKHHTEVLNYASELNFKHIYIYGNIYQRVYRERGVEKDRISVVKNFEHLAKEINKLNLNDTIILIKGSRKMEMENLVKLLIK